jgi:hypothetical protein
MGGLRLVGQKAIMKLAAAIILVVGLSTAAQAVETGTLTLACKGTTVTGEFAPEQLSMGLIFNFTAGTVQGFSTPDPGFKEVPVNITGIGEVTVTFGGSRRFGLGDALAHNLSGTIDRVTGDVDAEETITDGKLNTRTTYSLKCRPTQRMF